jgi:hypothetical protein
MSEQLWRSLSDNGLALTIAGCTLLAAGYLFVQVMLILRSFFKSDGVVVKWFDRNSESHEVISRAVDRLPKVVEELKVASAQQHDMVMSCANKQTDILQKMYDTQTARFDTLDKFHCEGANPNHPFSNLRTHKGLRNAVLAARYTLEHFLTLHPDQRANRDLTDAKQALLDAEKVFIGDK